MSNDALSSGKEAEMINNIASYGLWIGLIFQLLWLAILPVFILIWFNREKAKRDMSSW